MNMSDIGQLVHELRASVDQLYAQLSSANAELEAVNKVLNEIGAPTEWQGSTLSAAGRIGQAFCTRLPTSYRIHFGLLEDYIFHVVGGEESLLCCTLHQEQSAEVRSDFRELIVLGCDRGSRVDLPATPVINALVERIASLSRRYDKRRNTYEKSGPS